MRIKKGFTLSETMIAMSIVGIVVAATVPAVVNHFQKQSKVTKLEKKYQELSEQLELIKNERPFNSIPTLTLEEIKNGFKFKIVSRCENETNKCFADIYKSLSGNTINFNTVVEADKSYGLIIKDGSSIYIVPTNAEIDNDDYETICDDTSRVSSCYIKPNYDIKSTKLADVFLDINGKNGPNTGGRDMFRMGIYGDYTIKPVVIVEADDEGKVKNNLEICKGSPIGDGCFDVILNDDWKMNY